MTPFIVAINLVCRAADALGSHVLRAASLLDSCRADLPAVVPIVKDAASRLVKGGRLWADGLPALVSEVCGRAGGLMMIRRLSDAKAGPGDVVLFFPSGDQRPNVEDGCLVVTFGPKTGMPCERALPNHASQTGVSPAIGMAASAWVFTGEMVAACARLGRMPVMYESIGAYGGHPRIQQYKDGEIAWHEDLGVKPVPTGVVGARFIDTVSRMLGRIEKEHRSDLDRIGEWAREAARQGKRLYMYSMGHIFPDEIEKTDIGKVFRSGVWNAGFRGHKTPDDPYAQGDLVVHIGYQHPPSDLIRKVRSAGALVAYVSITDDRDFRRDAGVVRIDPMWDWPDACVEIEGCDVPILPASGIINSSVAWEIYRLSHD